MPIPSQVAATQPMSRHTVGELLRETRQSYAGDIDRIAATLRIRAAYLKAIEEGQYERLPGPVYALGFVRAYANHLGLDAEEAVRQFKQETAGFEIPRNLNFPVLLSERSIPGGTMLLAALILAVCGYGLWYYVSTGEHMRPNRVSSVPPEFSLARQQNPESQRPARSATNAEGYRGSAPAKAAQTSPSAVRASAEPKKMATSPAAASTTLPAAVRALDKPEAQQPRATARPPAPLTEANAGSSAKGSKPAPSPSVALLPAVTPTATAPSASTSGATPATPKTTVNVTVPVGATKTTPPTATLASQPHVYGVTDGPSRILIRANKDSWVLISDGDQVLMQGILHPGDSVRVPNQPGLVLETGNASGLQFEVDGKQAPAIGGRVRHHIALDPTRLMDGTAVSG